MKIGLIGTGKIGSVIIRALLRHVETPIEMLISSRGTETAHTLKSEFPVIKISDSNQHIINESDLIFFALRTDIALAELEKLHLPKGKKLVSVVPNTTMAKLQKILGPEAEIARMTPLPPAVDALGTVLLYNPFPELLALVEKIGRPLVCSTEKELHALWAVSCLISPYFGILSEITASSIRYGASPSQAKAYVASMFSALSESALRSEASFLELSEEAKTPGGLNELTDHFLHDAKAYELFSEAFDRVMERFPKAE